MSYREGITKTYAKSVERQIATSGIVQGISFKKEAKRIDGDWHVRWQWKIEGETKESCKWEGFKTLPACLKDLDATLDRIIKKEREDIKKTHTEVVI